jgi:hypothetical protein
MKKSAKCGEFCALLHDSQTVARGPERGCFLKKPVKKDNFLLGIIYKTEIMLKSFLSATMFHPGYY